jgi:hypothetical protein
MRSNWRRRPDEDVDVRDMGRSQVGFLTRRGVRAEGMEGMGMRDLDDDDDGMDRRGKGRQAQGRRGV